MKTKDKLINALREVGAPATILQRAKDGQYDMLESPLDNPIQQLVLDAEQCGLSQIAARARGGEFCATVEDAEAWSKQEPADRHAHKAVG